MSSTPPSSKSLIYSSIPCTSVISEFTLAWLKHEPEHRSPSGVEAETDWNSVATTCTCLHDVVHGNSKQILPHMDCVIIMSKILSWQQMQGFMVFLFFQQDMAHGLSYCHICNLTPATCCQRYAGNEDISRLSDRARALKR
jgi:hypothetical protein